ncbi:3-oxoacyl-[acyl-carrier protein] reductase [Scopulibacillus daqui]|uniref:3-oxoacyl-[acyl-carrier protein] reductase n=1 Tax=Scopulibacillus daqui TaxID=1469162 RepID=A0ABS2Q0S1_9BACL|nr:SDR family oxidoreductase [Scopulibacillus daqui]MBM7645901.1 3-oxoacyl-[acyl-carrier protein] reductase [Scopulibacillus daqui]
MSIFAKDALKGKHALVTGATGGIGSETAKLLAQMGADVTITGRRHEKLDKLAKEINEAEPHIKVFSYAADLGKEEDREKLVNAAEEALGPISLLVNNAGVLGGGPVDELEQAEMERIMHLNYTSTVLLTQLIYKTMKQRKDGAIVNVASLSGLRGTHGGTAYAASKFALIGFTHSMALEAIDHGIRVNAVCPGFVDTEMGRTSVQNKANHEQRSAAEVIKASIPSGRITTPKEVANTIAFLLTDAAENIVGESVKISGGSVLR